MEDDNGFKIKRVHILLAILCVLVLYIGVSVIRIYREDSKMRERFASGEFDDYHNQPNNIFGAPIVYFRSDLERVVGVRLREQKMEVAGIGCTKYWNNRNTPTKYDDLRFYIFDDERDAYKALNKIREKSFCEITDEGGNYVRGWLDGVVDAQIEDYYYVNGNLMVEAVVTSVDESARDVNDPTSPIRGGGREALELIKLINETF